MITTNTCEQSELKKNKVVLIPVFENNIDEAVKRIDGLKDAIASQDFKGEVKQTLLLKSFSGFKLVGLVGLGKKEDIIETEILKAGGRLASLAEGCGESNVALDLSFYASDEGLLSKLAHNLSVGLKLKLWKFDKYLTKTDKENNKKIEALNILLPSNVNVNNALEHAEAIVNGVYLTRELSTEPANTLHPESFAERISELKSVGLEIEILGYKELKELGMGALLSVNQASDYEAKVAIIKWNGGDSDPIAFIGKGVTFDSGGLSIKPSVGMMEMKRDMTGAATVVGAMKTLAMRKAKVNAIGVVGLVENMVDSRSMRPGDVITSHSGKTIEVLNTDAEGRLVLADVLNYTEKRFKPKVMIDIATLTGAIVVALGHSRAGLFCNDAEVTEQLLSSGETSGDCLWSFPVGEEYVEYLKSDIADICNISSPLGSAGSVTAAVFLKQFVNNTKWAHIDIAGVAWKKMPTEISSKGASGFGVKLLDSFVKDYYENK